MRLTARRSSRLRRIFSAATIENRYSYGFDLGIVQTYAWSPEGDNGAVRAFHGGASAVASALEHHVWEALGMHALSAARILHLSMLRGVPIRSGITKANWLQLSSEFHVGIGTLLAVSDAVEAGYIVTLPERDITVGDWHGTGFIEVDPKTNSAGYIISGGLSSGMQTISGGGMSTDPLKGLGGAFLAGFNIAGVGAQLALAEALMLGGGPVGIILGGAVAAAALADMADTLQDINDFTSGNVSGEDFLEHELTDAFVDKVFDHMIGNALEELAGHLLTPNELRGLTDVYKKALTEFENFITEDSGTASVDAASTLTNRDFILLAMHCASPEMWHDLYTVLRTRGRPVVDALVTNEDYVSEHAIQSVVHAIARAPQADGIDALIADAAHGPSYSKAYALDFAGSVGSASRYRHEYGVTYTPVTGFSADGTPVFGQPVAGTLTIPAEVLLGQWIYTQHAPVAAHDLRAWNTVAKLKAALDAKIRFGATVEAGGGFDPALIAWAKTNAPTLFFNTFQTPLR